jgi:hypothetical protein
MSEFVDYSRGLMDAAKGFRSHALSLDEGEVKQAFLRAAFLHACSFLEAHLNYLGEHFLNQPMFSLHEQGILLEREVRFEKGNFRMSDLLKISRISDRIDLLLSRCSLNPDTVKAGWYSDLSSTLRIRNSLVHPKDTHSLTEADVRIALVCVIAAVDTLYSAVFNKGLPYAKRGIEGGLDLFVSKQKN